MTDGLTAADADLLPVFVTHDVADLHAAIDRVVEARWGMAPQWVSYDQAGMQFPSGPVAVTLHDGPLMIEVAAELLHSEQPTGQLLHAVNVLNGGMPPYSFVLADGGDIEVRAYVQAVPFVPDHLYIALSLITDAVLQLGPQVAEMLGDES